MNDLSPWCAAGERSRTIELDEERSLHVSTWSKGADILLIHGALTTGRDWFGAPIEALQGLGRLIVIDRPGHGKSRRLRFEASPHAQAEQILGGLDASGIERPLIVAHSLGAAVALALAEIHPERVSGLVLVSPMVFPEARPLERALFGSRSLPGFCPAISALMNQGPDRPILEQMHRLMFFPDARPASWEANYPWAWMLSPDGGVINGEEFAVMHPWTLEAPRAERIDVPASIIVGDKDAIVRPAGQGLALASMMPNARLIRLADAGHMLHHTHPDAVAEAVAACLHQVEA